MARIGDLVRPHGSDQAFSYETGRLEHAGLWSFGLVVGRTRTATSATPFLLVVAADGLRWVSELYTSVIR